MSYLERALALMQSVRGDASKGTLILFPFEGLHNAIAAEMAKIARAEFERGARAQWQASAGDARHLPLVEYQPVDEPDQTAPITLTIKPTNAKNLEWAPGFKPLPKPPETK